MPIPFLSSINLTKNEVENFKIYNLANDPGTLTSGGDFGYFWLNTSSQKTLKWWDGANVRSIVDSTNIGSYTSGLATDLAGGAGGYLPYQAGTNDTTFLPLGTAAQILAVNSGITGPEWINQSAITAGSVANALTAGTYLTSGGTYNGSAARTFAVDATSANTASKVVARDASGNFSAGTITASLSGNATSADSVNNALTAGTYLTSGGTFNGSVARTFAVDATSSNTASKVVARDASGNFSAGTITATTVTGLSAPSAGSDAANRDYVDSVAQGLDVKASCLVATTADITLSSPGAISIDNIPSTSFTAGTTRILVRAQNTASQNGIYIWNGSGSAMTRSADANTWDELVSAFTFIEQGDTLKDTGWVCTIDAGTLGTTAVTWSQFSGAGSYTANRGLVLSGTAFNFAQNSDYAVGDLPYATGQTTIGLLPAVATGNALISGGVATAPSWGKIGLTTHVSGTLPIANGGTGATSFTQGQVLFAGASAISSSANLFWDNANNRLGIGTATPSAPLHVEGANVILKNGTGVPYFQIGGRNTDGRAEFVFLNNGLSVNNAKLVGYTNTLAFEVAGSERLRIASDGVCTWSNVGGVAGTAMTLNGTGLGIGASPSTNLHVYGAAPRAMIENSANTGIYLRLKRPNKEYIVALDINNNGGNDFTIWDNTAAASRLTIDNVGNVGIGTASPSYKLDVAGLIRTSGTGYDSVGAPTLYLRNTTASTGRTFALNSFDGGGFQIFDVTASNATRLIIDPSGNLGLGVTPKTWAASYKAFQIGSYSSIQDVSGFTIIGCNYYNDGADKSLNGGAVSRYLQNAGAHTWQRVTTSTANNTIAFTDSMVLDASGNLALGTATANFRADIQNASGAAILRLKGGTGAAQGSAVYMTYAGSANTLLGIGDRATILGGTPDQLACIYSGVALTFEISGAERLRIKSTGQVNFVGLASDPAGAAGDVYYNSGSNVFKVYDTGWKTLPRKYSTALAGTSTTFDVTHNLGTQDVTVMVRKSASTFDVVYTDIQVATTNKVTIVFASSVTGSDYTVTVIG